MPNEVRAAAISGPVEYPITSRERRLYTAVALVLGLNLFVIFGALTFFALVFRK